MALPARRERQKHSPISNSLLYSSVGWYTCCSGMAFNIPFDLPPTQVRGYLNNVHWKKPTHISSERKTINDDMRSTFSLRQLTSTYLHTAAYLRRLTPFGFAQSERVQLPSGYASEQLCPLCRPDKESRLLAKVPNIVK